VSSILLHPLVYKTINTARIELFLKNYRPRLPLGVNCFSPLCICLFLMLTYLVLLDPEEFLPLATFSWCCAWLEASDISFVPEITLSARLADGSLMHEKAYHVLRTALQAEVFHHGYSLPRCLPPEGEYNWTPPVTSLVETLSPAGEEILLQEVLHSTTLDHISGIRSEEEMSGDDDTGTDD